MLRRVCFEQKAKYIVTSFEISWRRLKNSEEEIVLTIDYYCPCQAILPLIDRSPIQAMAGIISTGAIAALHVWPRGLVAQDSSAGKGSLRVGGHRWRHTPPRTKKGLAPTQLAVRSKKGGGEEWVLAIDVGTGGTKAALVTSLGSVASSAFHPHPAPSSSPAYDFQTKFSGIVRG